MNVKIAELNGWRTPLIAAERLPVSAVVHACHNTTIDQGLAELAVSGLTRETLSAWLRGSHNFPDMMSFSIDADRIDDLSAYMLTLRESG